MKINLDNLLISYKNFIKKPLNLLFIFIIFSPGILQIVLNHNKLLETWKNIPLLMVSSFKSRLNDEYLNRLVEMRWVDYKLHRDDMTSKILYSKHHFVIKNIFDWIQFATPRLYFLTGDGSIMSPAFVEPIPVILFPFWIIGIVSLINHEKIKYLYYLLFFTSLGFFTGTKNLAILWPILLTYLIISIYGIVYIRNNRFYTYIVSFILIYYIYCFDMALYAR